MRISDWSSDVCSSDLNPEPLPDEGIENDDFEPPPGAAEQHARYPKQRALCQAGKAIKRLRLVAHELARQRFPAELRIGQHRPVVGDRLHDRLPIRAAWRDAHAGPELRIAGHLDYELVQPGFHP